MSPRPKDGSQRNVTANSRISRIPVTKVGVDTPTSDTACTPLASGPRGLIAVSTPSGMPMASASAVATATSSSVAGSRSAIMSETGR